LEGTARLLYPQFQLMEVIEPFQQKMVADRLSPWRQYRRLRHFMRDWRDLAVHLPSQLRDMMHKAQTGRVEVQLQHHHLEPSVNRMVLGLITSAMLLGSSLLWAAQAPPAIMGISIVGVLGFLVSGLCAIGLIRAILRSGHLDG
jgi:ubiquinone biosynthesis protein